MATQDAHKELFLDILTKEEREALLNKKMENLRKQNEAIQKRYAEVEADKKRADVKLGSKLPAQKETYIVPRALPPSEDHDPRKIKQTQQQQQQQSQQQQQLLQQQQQQLQQQQQQLQQQQQQLQQPQNSRPATRNKPPPAQGGGGGRGARERPKSQDFRSEAGYQYEPIVDIADLDSRHAKRALSPSKARRNAPKEGPPPDPAYNYLADRTRESNAGGRQIEKPSSQDGFVGGGGSTRGGKDLRRHPRNFGGQDFTNVRQQMKTVKEKEKDRRSFPPRNRLEMSVNMTGTERVQYDEWKTERQKVDQDRIDRQKTSSGEWRRAWDQEKHQREYEEQSSSNRTEPARRPVGRIGSGRFDRGDREDRRAEGQSQNPKAPSAVQNIPPPEVLDRKPPGAGRGRGRGRGRARAQQGGESGRPGERPPRPRTWSGGDESRTVECSNDMLVVKIDKSRSSDDHSVEVEYEEPEKRKSSPTKKKPTRRSPTKQKQQHLQHPPQFQDADIHPGAKAVSPPLLTTMSSQDSSNYDGRPASLSQSLSIGSTDDWETTEDEGEALRRTAKLNPEAPVFQPNSPDLTISPPVQSGFGLPPQEQRTNRSSRVAGGLTGSLNVAASSFGGPTSASSPKAAPLTSVKIAEETTVNGKAADDIAEEEEEEEDGEEEEILAERELEDVDEEEDDEEYFHDSEDKVEKEGEEELPSESHDSQVEKDSREEAEAQGESSLADELSGSTPSSSLADELSAAGAPRPHADGLHAHESVKDDPASQDVHEIEEDDEIEDDEDESVPVEEEKDTVEEEKDTVEEERDTVEEKKESVPVKEQKETVPVVSDDTVPKGESLPETATASDETATEEEKHASQDADSSCSSAPADGSSGSSPMPSGKQMAAKEEEGGSQEGAMEPSSSQLTSSATEGTKESAKSDVMEKPDAEHVNGDTTEATALS